MREGGGLVLIFVMIWGILLTNSMRKISSTQKIYTEKLWNNVKKPYSYDSLYTVTFSLFLTFLKTNDNAFLLRNETSKANN